MQAHICIIVCNFFFKQFSNALYENINKMIKLIHKYNIHNIII